MLQSWWNDNTTDFHAEEYRTKITKVKFKVNVKVPNNNIMSWDVSEAKDKSVMAWIEDDGAEGYILTIAGKEKILANENSGAVFYGFDGLNEIENLKLLDTSNIINIGTMFYACSSLTSLDLTNFDTRKVKNMESVFQYCKNIKNINLGENFNTSNVTSMDQIFRGCEKLIDIDLSNFDIRNLKSTYNMFAECKSLTKLDLSNFNTSDITKMEGMFKECTNLKSINFGENFDTRNVTNMSYMFYRCYNLTATVPIQNDLNFSDTFKDAAIIAPAQITLNYTTESESIVDSAINLKRNSNLVKGVQI